MNDYGSSPFNAGFGRPMQPPPVPPVPRRESSGASKPFLVVLLIVSCVVLGGLLNWGLRQRHERARLFERNIEVEQSYVTVLAKRNDLASFLTDPRTRLYRLAGRAGANGRTVTVAWQEATRTGVLVGDDVPLPGDRHAYALWMVDGEQRPVLCGTFRPEPGVTYYDFRAPATAVTTSAAAADGGGGEAVPGFRVTDEADAHPNAPGAAVYEAR